MGQHGGAISGVRVMTPGPFPSPPPPRSSPCLLTGGCWQFSLLCFLCSAPKPSSPAFLSAPASCPPASRAPTLSFKGLDQAGQLGHLAPCSTSRCHQTPSTGLPCTPCQPQLLVSLFQRLSSVPPFLLPLSSLPPASLSCSLPPGSLLSSSSSSSLLLLVGSQVAVAATVAVPTLSTH